MAQDNRPKNLTIRGRLSFPNFTYASALDFNKRSEHAKPEEDVRPNFHLVLDESGFEKVAAYLRDVFLPWTVEQGKLPDGSKKSGLSAKQAKALQSILDEDPSTWVPKEDGLMGLLYPLSDKTKELAPEGVVAIKVNGFKQRDLELKAIVRSEEELRNAIDAPDIPERGLILPVGDTNHELYAGAVVASTINMWAFTSAGQPGITCNTSTAVFVADAERFGGGGAILDEDDIFLDD